MPTQATASRDTYEVRNEKLAKQELGNSYPAHLRILGSSSCSGTVGYALLLRYLPIFASSAMSLPPGGSSSGFLWAVGVASLVQARGKVLLESGAGRRLYA
jgi:hypothetical protein